MVEDTDLAGLAKLVEAIESMSPEARQRNLRYVVDRFGIVLSSPPAASRFEAVQRPGRGEVESFADLFERAAPSTDKDKALTAAYWFQICQGQGEFLSAPVNSALKNLGFGLSNVAESLRRCCADKPATAMQLRKSGQSQQSRKAFKLTQAGIRRVETLLSSSTDPSEVTDG